MVGYRGSVSADLDLRLRRIESYFRGIAPRNSDGRRPWHSNKSSIHDDPTRQLENTTARARPHGPATRRRPPAVRTVFAASAGVREVSLRSLADVHRSP